MMRLLHAGVVCALCFSSNMRLPLRNAADLQSNRSPDCAKWRLRADLIGI